MRRLLTHKRYWRDFSKIETESAKWSSLDSVNFNTFGKSIEAFSSSIERAKQISGVDQAIINDMEVKLIRLNPRM